MPATDARGLLWLGYARQCVGLAPTAGGWDAPAFTAAALALAAHPPVQARWSDLKIEVQPQLA
jgi:hypothetical protein